jgi:GNAT superfamily N-acetyltransferase
MRLHDREKLMDFRFEPVSTARLGEYEALFRRCFPGAGHMDRPYLEWLYCDNPDGAMGGFDAWAGERLAAHYACAPARARIEGQSCTVALSLNTATDPDFQGKGLFTRLAEKTYADLAAQGVRAVYGVANANSTPGFLRKLGFTLVRRLDAVVGVGPLRRGESAVDDVQFCREWSATSLDWRMRNPVAPLRACAHAGSTAFFAATRWPLLSAYAELEEMPPVAVSGQGALLRVFVGCLPQGERLAPQYLHVPQFLRPSPLNLIYRDLVRPGFSPDPGKVRVSFLDFDAF